MDLQILKILHLEEKKAVETLKSYLETLDNQHLVDYVSKHYKSSSFSTFWNVLLKTFEKTSDDHEKRLAVTLELLNKLEKNATSTMHCSNLITRFCIELTKFKIKDLMTLCNICLEYVQKGASHQMVWKDIFPELINIISEKTVVEYDNDDISGVEYRLKMLESLCSMQWDADILTPLAIMFIDMQLSKEEHNRIVYKFGQSINSMTCTELPALVYQMLRLCRSMNGRNIFMNLQSYFDVRIYSKPFHEGSNSMDLIDEAISEDYIQAESTILYHIHQAASLGYETIKDYLNSLKHLTKAPEYILKPFQLTVLLSIGSICFYEETVFDIIRSAISRSINEEARKSSSYWLTETLKRPVNIEEIFSRIISLCGENRDFVLQGLVGISFNLMSVGAALGRDEIAEKQWYLGRMVLLKLIRMKRHTAPSIVQMLCNKVTLGQNATSHITCLHLLTKSLPLVILENQTYILEMINTLVQVPYSTAINILDSVIPLVKISPTIRDHLILLLRKALYSRSTNTRQAAVTGFLNLLKKLKISNLMALSQSSNSSSGHSVLTQISLSNTGRSKAMFSNEALCLEVLGILKKCFTQQADVRLQLYDGLYESVCKNPELSETVFELIWNHFVNFQALEEDEVPPLLFGKVIQSKDAKVTLIEPLGKLIFVIGVMLVKIKKENAEDLDEKYNKYTRTFDSLCERMARCELSDFDMEDDNNEILETSPESSKKLIILQEVLHVFDALMGYKIYEWSNDSGSSGEVFMSLFQAYNRFMQFYRDLSKPKKGDKKKKKDTDTTQNVTRNTTTVKTSKAFSKSVDTVLNFEVLEKIMKLLYDDVSWTTTQQSNLLKTKTDVHRYIIQSTSALINVVKGYKSVEQDNLKVFYKHCSEIGQVLYKFVIVKLETLVDFDIATASMGIECLHSIFQYISAQFKGDFGNFLSTIAEKENEEFPLVLSDILEVYQNLLRAEFNESDNVEFKALRINLLNTFMMLCGQVPSRSHVSQKTIDWLKSYLSENTEKDKNIAVSFVTLTLNQNRKYRDSTAIVENILLKVSDIVGTLNNEELNCEEVKLINEGSCNGSLQATVGLLKTMLDDVDWVMTRLKSEFAYIQYPGCENLDTRKEEILKLEKNVCVQICLIAMQISIVSNITVKTGPILEGILKLLVHFYNSLTILTKYFMSRSSKLNLVFQKAQFEHVIKMAGKTLSPIVYKLILFIDEYQKQEAEAQKSKDASTLKNKVLKETKLIPKVVYEIEQLSRSVIQLSNKAKVDLTKYIGQGTTRDFRLLQLKEVVENTRAISDNEDETTANETNNDTSVNQTEEDNDDTDASENDENGPPPTKKAKK